MRKTARPPIATELEYAARFEAEKARHSNAIAMHSGCGAIAAGKECKRARRCCGDVNACLAKAVARDRVPHREAWRARQDIVEAMPCNLGRPERAARQCMPGDFYDKKSRW
jgi:hypothetical protein